MKQNILFATLLLATHMAFADASPVVLEENQTLIQVNGVVCSFCAYGAEKALSELDGLDKEEFGNGVLVDVETHRITIALQPGQKIPFREIYERIKKAGYDPITLHVRPEGKLERSGENLVLRDSKSGQVFSISNASMTGITEEATVVVQAHFDASQIPELGETEPVKVTIDRLIQDSNGVSGDDKPAPKDG